MAYEALLAEYDARRKKALAGGGADKYAKRKAAGVWNAREGLPQVLELSLTNFNADPKREFVRERELLCEVLHAAWLRRSD